MSVGDNLAEPAKRLSVAFRQELLQTGRQSGFSPREIHASLDPAAKARWDAVVKHCHLGRASSEGWHPAVGYQSLMNAYYGLLGIGDAAAEVHARGYKRCMAAAGIQADNASVLPDALVPDFPPDQAPAHGPGGPLFQKWVTKGPSRDGR